MRVRVKVGVKVRVRVRVKVGIRVRRRAVHKTLERVILSFASWCVFQPYKHCLTSIAQDIMWVN